MSDLIKQFEGCRLKAYRCSAGVWTIGYGHTGGVYDGMIITQDQADSFLIADIAKARRGIVRLITVPLTENQLASLTSFVFNLGAGSLQASTLRRKINRGEYAADEFRKWVYAGGVKLAGLVRRREAERALFLS